MLAVRGCNSLKAVHRIADTLHTLNLSGCKELSDMSAINANAATGLSSTVKMLDLRGCVKLDLGSVYGFRERYPQASVFL